MLYVDYIAGGCVYCVVHQNGTCAYPDAATYIMALFHCMIRHGTVQYFSFLGGFPLGIVLGTWYFF